jgi:hypothetical protein
MLVGVFCFYLSKRQPLSIYGSVLQQICEKFAHPGIALNILL